MAASKGKTPEKMTLEVLRGIRIKGQMVFPNTKKGKGETPTVITVPYVLGQQLIAASKAKESEGKVTVEVKDDEDDFEVGS